MSAAQPIELRAGDRQKGRGGLRAFGQSLERSIDRSPLVAFTFLSAIYFVAVFSLSSLKLLWLDELITLHIAKLASFSAIWHALQRGVDPNPPVTHQLVAWSRAIFGDHEFAYRVPPAVGYWLGLVALFAYLRRHVPPTWALIGCVMSMAMAAFDYSYESRSYGIFYGLAMAAFFCWSTAVDASHTSRTRYMALGGMVLSLADGISTNYFAVLAFLPIGAGEAVRTLLDWRSNSNGNPVRRLLQSIDLRVSIGLIVAATPLIAYRPLIAHSIAQFAPYAWNKVSMQQVFDSYTEMVEIILYPILALFVFAFFAFFASRGFRALCRDCRSSVVPRWVATLVDRPALRLRVPVHEAIGILFLMAYPFLGYVIASIRGGMLSPRFVIPVCFGFAIAATLVAFELFRSLPSAAIALLCLVSAWFICRESYVGYWYEEQKECFYKVLDHLPEAEALLPSNAPIVIPDPLLALTLQHYAPASISGRLVFPVDFPAVRFYRHDDSPEENLWAGRDFLYTIPIEPLATFEHSAGSYLIIAGDGNWLLEDLNRHNYNLHRLSINTRAAAIGGFTPLAHGTPAFYTASGDAANDNDPDMLQPTIPFRAADNLPSGKLPEIVGATP